jgi:hypothetical protein
MNYIKARRLRPFLIFLLFLAPSIFHFNELREVAEADTCVFENVVYLIVLSLILNFQIREKISITNNVIHFKLQKVKGSYNKGSIVLVELFDCGNDLQINSEGVQIKLDIHAFKKNEIYRFFKENNVEIKNNQ